MFKPKSWLSGFSSKPRNPHSLEHLKYLYGMLCKNQTVNEYNRSLLVETLRSISEILIWGDQNDSSVFDFFLEKNMLSFFLRYLRQKSGRYICVQLLQTLNILFENISNETSLYYLLSNNHVNSIIVHKFDFSDEEVMAYYISFLKTLSLKLNRHTIHFFYNEHTNDFALYTEAIKFFNHSENMVRIAVRTIILNVYRVEDKAMLRYIRDHTAAPYFSNLVWFIGNHILDLDTCVRNDADHQSRNRLADLVAIHLDHLHYVNDILLINIDMLNDVLSDHLLNRLLVPLYVYSLTKRKKNELVQGEKKYVSSVVALFLLSQVFLIINYSPLVRQLAEIIFLGNVASESREGSPNAVRVREFTAPEVSLEQTLNARHSSEYLHGPDTPVTTGNSTFFMREADRSTLLEGAEGGTRVTEMVVDAPTANPCQNSTDEEKLLSTQRVQLPTVATPEQRQAAFSLENRPYLESIFNALECSENDYETLFALCLLYAMGHNNGIHQGLMDSVLMPTDRSKTKDCYNVALVERLIRIITLACQHGSKVRLATLELCIRLLKQLVYQPGKSYLQDRHLACLENARECSTQILRNFYKSEEIFLDMFEDEHREMTNRPLNVEYLTMDASILLPPTGTPLTGIDFNKRLPCGEVERARRAIRVFFLVRDMSLTLMQEPETQLPLTKDADCVKIDNILDLNNSDLIACTVVTKERRQERRFLVIDTMQMILVEPDNKRLGWGIVRFVGFLQDVEVTGDKEDSRSLHITIHKPASSQHAQSVPLLAARFIFDDHIRCMAAKQRLTKGRIKARHQKMQMIEKLLEIPVEASLVASIQSGHFTHSGPIPGRSHPVRVSNIVQQRTASKVPSTSDLTLPSQSQTAQHTGRVNNPNVLCQRSEITIQRDQVQNQDYSSNAGSGNIDSTMYDDVEIAEEATSEMAFQKLNQYPTPPTPSRRSPASSDNGTQGQDIPLEDLSKKKKAKKRARIKLEQARLQRELEAHSRSQSQSPNSEHGERGRSHSLITGATQTVRSRSGTPVGRTHSLSNPLPRSASPSRSEQPFNASGRSHYNHRLKSKGKESPKTLMPAMSPALSLASPEETPNFCLAATLDTPKLIPQAGVEKVEIVSGISNTSSEGECSDTSKSSVDLPEQPNVSTKKSGQAEMSSASMNVQTISQLDFQVSSATRQLRKLAQMVQEHYKFSDVDDAKRVTESELLFHQ
ncbi:hypothetical protein CHS0354_035123 [Potamilus streckersoni]|uniref:Protein CLEC16A n=1 Tax=Potamilus streckersoni TaxID=2493646 RepID=A0AAE0TCK4_9BIVA|nr:hypothetical protein CHS0354_035123 [Potamilus streckersoni]